MLVSLVLVWALKTKQLTKQCINKGYMCLFSTFIICLQKLRMTYILYFRTVAVYIPRVREGGLLATLILFFPLWVSIFIYIQIFVSIYKAYTYTFIYLSIFHTNHGLLKFATLIRQKWKESDRLLIIATFLKDGHILHGM